MEAAGQLQSSELNLVPPTTAPHFLKLYEFEKYHDHERFTALLERNWSWILYLSAFYILMVHHGQRLMADKKPLRLRKTLFLWNGTLVLFSLAVCARMIPELWWQWSQTGFEDTLCHFGSQKSITELWGVVFAFSKVFEFGDTLFLVLAKKPVIFLHWYHHATVAIYGFYVGDINDPASRWFVLINSFVHCIMYSYYALKALNVYVPRTVSVAITSLQISQMVFGIYINIVTTYWKVSGVTCERSARNIQVAAAMYATYLILFANFFYKSYLAKRISPALQKSKEH